MKKKPTAEHAISHEIISPKILEMAKKSVEAETARPQKRCVVCGASSTQLTGPNSEDDLCWVCRRLKVSAWRENDQQMSAQE
jgi:hypothetical protein